MIDLELLDKEIKEGKFKNSYVFCGLDEMLIKENIDIIINKAIDRTFKDLNLIKIDGNNSTFDEIMNACETLPFMSDKKVVVVYRANFLKDKTDSAGLKVYNEIKEYLKNLPEQTILIMYYLFGDKRERPNKNKKFHTLDKLSTVVYADKLRGERLYKKVNNIFEKKAKKIGRVELRFFCDSVENNFDIIEREIDKLINYTLGRDIKKEDISLLLPNKGEDDVFDLVDFISQRKPEKAIDIMNDLLNKGENIMLILTLIANQFNMLFRIKVALNEGKNKEVIAREIHRPVFVVEKLIGQSRKFTIKQIESCMEEFIETEKKLKSSSLDKKIELELFIMKTVIVSARS